MTTGAQRAGATPAARLAANLNGGEVGRPTCMAGYAHDGADAHAVKLDNWGGMW
jgi:hypothetical protein